MLALLATAAGTAITPAMPRHPGSWVTPADYPRAAVDGRESGHTVITVLVSAEGRVRRCNVTASSGYADLDTVTCDLLFERARFDPATDPNGKPMIGTWSSQVTWSVGGNTARLAEWQRTHPTPALELEDVTVAQLPPRTKNPISITVGLLVSPDDQVQGCGPDPEAQPALAAIACQHAVALARPHHETDAAGTPIASVQSVTIKFETAAGFAAQ